MAITPLPSLDRTSPSFRSDLDSYFGAALPAFASQANALAANLNSIAAGGAYSLPYVWGATGANGSVGGVNGGRIGTDSGAATQSVAVTLYIDNKDSKGNVVGTMLDGFSASSSAVKGVVRIVKANDSSIFLTMNVTAVAASGNYRYMTVTNTGASGASPFINGDAVMLFFQRTGDKGDTGPAYAPKIMIVRDQKAAGVAAQSITGNTWVARELNTVAINEITGASLANNEITLPAGTFWFEATVPGAQCGQFTCRLQDSTNNVLHDYGTAEFANNSAPGASASHIVAIIGNSAPRKFRIDQLQSITQNGGVGGTAAPNFYTQVKITKVA